MHIIIHIYIYNAIWGLHFILQQVNWHLFMNHLGCVNPGRSYRLFAQRQGPNLNRDVESILYSWQISYILIQQCSNACHILYIYILYMDRFIDRQMNRQIDRQLDSIPHYTPALFIFDWSFLSFQTQYLKYDLLQDGRWHCFNLNSLQAELGILIKHGG